MSLLGTELPAATGAGSRWEGLGWEGTKWRQQTPAVRSFCASIREIDLATNTAPQLKSTGVQTADYVPDQIDLLVRDMRQLKEENERLRLENDRLRALVISKRPAQSRDSLLLDLHEQQHLNRTLRRENESLVAELHRHKRQGL